MEHNMFVPLRRGEGQFAVVAQSVRKPKKKLIRRTDADRSQVYRRSFQGAFLVLNLWLGGKFYFWVRQFEVGVIDTNLHRPPGVEGWLPIAGMMNLKYWVLSGKVPQVHPAALFLLVTFLATSFLFRKAFCSWLCPIGTISEYLWRAGKKLFRWNFQLPCWLDLPLRGLKYFCWDFSYGQFPACPRWESAISCSALMD
jgi:polyferredoxin